MTEYKGEELKKLLEKQILLQDNAINTSILKFESIDTFHKFHHTILSIEEFINITVFGNFSKADTERLNSISLVYNEFLLNATGIKWIIGLISTKYSKVIAERYLKTLAMISSINQAFFLNRQTSFGYGLNMNDIQSAVLYFQSRRRYFVTFLYLIPKLCKGQEKMSEMDTINFFLPIIEHSCVSLTTMNQQQILSRIFSDYVLVSDGVKLQGNYQFNFLETFSAEPERISLLDQVMLREEQVIDYTKLPVSTNKIFSFDELTNSVNFLSAAYDFYEITDINFHNTVDFILSLKPFCKDDYYIVMSNTEFDNLVSKYPNSQYLFKAFLNESENYVLQLNSFHPFIKISNQYISNVNLLMRFLYYFKNAILYRKKRFQIHSGFVFEDKVKEVLEENNFEVTDITRIDRKEFDLITIVRTTHFTAIKNDTIYNFQCKNNAIDLTLIENAPETFIKYNNKLIKYYESALLKEKNREGLITKKLGINEIEHYIISRFPIITNNTRVIAFNNLQEWIDKILK